MRTCLTPESRERLARGILSRDPVTGLTHNFYRYPARFRQSLRVRCRLNSLSRVILFTTLLWEGALL